jgi:hypothetical protein
MELGLAGAATCVTGTCRQLAEFNRTGLGARGEPRRG